MTCWYRKDNSHWMTSWNMTVQLRHSLAIFTAYRYLQYFSTTQSPTNKISKANLKIELLILFSDSVFLSAVGQVNDLQLFELSGWLQRHSATGTGWGGGQDDKVIANWNEIELDKRSSSTLACLPQDKVPLSLLKTSKVATSIFEFFVFLNVVLPECFSKIHVINNLFCGELYL